MENLYLFHATDRKNLESIMKNGLLINPPDHNWKDMYCEGKIFLAFDTNVAEDYAMSSENAPEEVVILKIPLNALHEQSIGYDWNNRCEYQDDINSCVYTLDIPANCISIASTDEDEQVITDFKGTLMYERIMNVFDEEVETNLERLDDDY